MRWFQRPPQERNGIIEAEHAVVIFDVVVAQQHVNLLSLTVIIDVARVPLELLGQLVRLVSDLVRALHLVDGATVLGVLGAHGRHRLRVPEGMWPLHLAPGLFADARAPQELHQLLLAAQVVFGLVFLVFLTLSRVRRRTLGLALLVALLLALLVVVLNFLPILDVRLLLSVAHHVHHSRLPKLVGISTCKWNAAIRAPGRPCRGRAP
jgi:hypothetical protein